MKDDGHDRAEREAWLRREVLAGRPQAWEELARSAFAGVARSVRAAAPRVQDVDREEAVQEAWMIALKRIRSFDPQRGGFDAWVAGIARRRLSERSRPAALPLSQAAALAGSEAVASEATLATRETLSGLDPEARALLVEHHAEEQPLNSLAARRGKTRKAIESALARARASFRTAFARSEADGPKPDAPAPSSSSAPQSERSHEGGKANS